MTQAKGGCTCGCRGDFTLRGYDGDPFPPLRLANQQTATRESMTSTNGP